MYLLVVLDLYGGKIVEWQMHDHPRTELPLAALLMTNQRQRQEPASCIIPIAGSRYVSAGYRAVLEADGMVQSMSRTGNCRDNAPMESFFGTAKVDLAITLAVPDLRGARRDLSVAIEACDSRQRIHSALSDLTPEQAERSGA